MGILEEAKELTSNDRQEQYGNPRSNFDKVARLWSAYLHGKVTHTNMTGEQDIPPINITPKDVAFMMTLLKIAREQFRHKKDNLVDAAGYIRVAAMVEGIG